MRKSIWVVIALTAFLSFPTMAHAEEINYLESFANGFETLKGNDVSESVTPERDYAEGYEPQEVILTAPSESDLPDDASTVDYVNNTVDSFNSVQWGFGSQPLFNSIRTLFIGTTATREFMLVIPAGLVFMWWGVRKVKSIIWTAFRTGRLNLGTSVKRAYYRRKAKEWYG